MTDALHVDGSAPGNADALRIVSFNTLFGGYDNKGLGAPKHWSQQMEFLRSLKPDILCLQECNFWELLGYERFYRAIQDTGMAKGVFAFANKTTKGHRFHSVMLFSDRVGIEAADADRNGFHHVMGWATLRLPGVKKRLEMRNLQLSPFDPRLRTREVGPLEVLADPDVLAVAVGDANTLGQNFPEPPWRQLPQHMRNGHLRLPRERPERPEEWVADRDALELLDVAGFVDLAVLAGRADVPTGGFAEGDVERRQDVMLGSPGVAHAMSGYTVHMEPIELGMTDHAAVSGWLDLSALR